MNKNKIISKVKGYIIDNPEIFDDVCNLHLYDEIKYETEEGVKLIDLYFPKKVHFGSVDGYKLKDNKGYISLNQRYKQINAHSLELVYFSYKYITGENNYKCEHVASERKKTIDYYSFHYDQDYSYQELNTDEKSQRVHSLTHLHVLHHYPRFSVKDDFSIAEFIDIIKDTCFEDGNGIIAPLFNLK